MGEKLYVGNLAYSVDDNRLTQMFSEHGTVSSAQVIMDRDTGRPTSVSAGETDAVANACPRPGADRRGLAPLQEAAGAQRPAERVAEAQALREAVRGPPPGQAAQTRRHPQGQGAQPERLTRWAP